MIYLHVNRAFLNKSQLYTLFYLLLDVNDKIEVVYDNRNTNGINIYYGVESDNGIVIPCIYDAKEIKYIEHEGRFIASFDNFIEPYTVEMNRIKYNFDIVNTSKYFITMQEEHEINERDDKERFIASLSKRKEHINIPFFDTNRDMLINTIRKIYPKVEIKIKTTEILLSHDVDSLNSRDKYVFLHNAKNLLLGRNEEFNQRFNTLFGELFTNKDRQINNYIEIENKYNAKSEFYFIEGKEHRLGKRYDLNNYVDEILNLKFSKNHKIGIHTNYFSYLDETKIKDEKISIEKKADVKVDSCRNHYLRFKMPDTLYALMRSGVKYDSTLGYSDINGFRAATSRSFVPFDLLNNKLIDIYEIPLVVMDGIVMEKKISYKDKWELIKNILDQVINQKGTASVLWHQRVIKDPIYKNMYIDIIEYCSEKGCKFIFTDELEESYKNEYEQLSNLLDSFI